MTGAQAERAAVWLVVSAAAWALFLGVRWVRQQQAMLGFLTDATVEIEGMLPGLQASAALFEARWADAWDSPDWEGLSLLFGGEPTEALRTLYADPSRRRVEDVRLRGPGAPEGGVMLKNYFPVSATWTIGMVHPPQRDLNEYPFAHDDDDGVYLVDWLAGSPVWRVKPEGERTRIAESLAAFLAWR